MSENPEVIMYEGDNSIFIWKHPNKDFLIGTQLIVHESQEAIFFMNGQALDLFPPGRYSLNTQNIPLILKHLKASKSIFHCEVYFINKTEQMAIKWGTDSKVEYIEPTYNFPISIGASGEMSLRVEDSRKLLVKIVGTESSITQAILVQKFRGFLMTHVKTYLSNLIREKKINIFSIDEHLQEISSALHKKLSLDFSDYGVSLERFFVTTIIKPEEDKSYQKFKDIFFRKFADVEEAKLRKEIGIIDQLTQAERMKIEAESKAFKRKVEGYSYQDERGFDVAERISSNEAVGQINNIGVGLGMISGISTTIGSSVSEILQKTVGNANSPKVDQSEQLTRCPSCGNLNHHDANFCSTCGERISQQVPSKIYCPNCGKELQQGDIFCKNCGRKLLGEKDE